ncbi:lysosomal alpha-glucosidase-like [Plodia interpunctella]|uniref:lysosomal alpha-glucosidase-like n=1 Tax=Plodia interpunctella TaxID=58824 RepID=UPI002367E861|nr:lysosomal alpha-glucosidase-like [Plodia interpunctella]XP_053606390.1 lysosomal alpha-glucosidase-like [Plodia interpunctella]
MPKIPYKPENSDENDDYEIVSFEDFCDKSPNSKTDLLTLNDNINYRLCFESDKGSKYENQGEGSNRDAEQHSETSLNDSKNVTFKRRLSNSFAPFGRSPNVKTGRPPLFSGVIPKPRNDGESTSREHRYQRFSENRNIFQRWWEHLPSMGSGVLGLALLCALCVGVWWAATGAMGGAWQEEHYRKLWERAHPDMTDVKKPTAPLTYEKILPEYRYHDHNNLSTKNKNSTEQKKKEPNKKSYLDEDVDVKELCTSMEQDRRFDCFPQGAANEADCVERGCCWKPATTKEQDSIPYCFYPPKYDTYRMVNMSESNRLTYVYYEKNRPSGYPDDFQVAVMRVKKLSDTTVRVTIYDGNNQRFEPPYPDVPTIGSKLQNPQYRVKIPEDGSSTGLKIVRNSDNVTIFDTVDVGGLILSDKFLQISILTPTDHIFGLGERRARFMVDMDWRTFGLWNRDRAPVENANLYGTQPYYMGVEHDGKTHGVLFHNANAMDIVTQPTPALTFRTVGGVLDFYIFLGPTPDDVTRQLSDVIGKPFLPPYWSLGFHLSRFNYGSLNNTRQVWANNRNAGIPFDVQWNDIDYMKNRNDFTYDEEKFGELPQFVDELHKAGMHYVMIVDPGISASEAPGTYPPYERGMDMNIFTLNSSGLPLVGKVWNRESTVFPDFTHPNVTSYWVEMLQSFHQKIKYDGVWIDMNEPSNMVDGALIGSCKPEELPYKPHLGGDQLLRTKTLCMDAQHYAGSHYDWHNLYGIAEAMVTNFALKEIRGKRAFVISRSTYTGAGAYCGHWSGDVASSWRDLRMSVPELLNFAIFGVPMMGADICGFRGDTTAELCKRWMQLGAFYPFSRNHNSDTSKPQDPASLGADTVRASVRALRLRYRLLPHYYTLFYRAYLQGDTVLRPLFYLYPDNVAVHAIDTQFLIGPYIMVTPILEEGATTTKAYYPGPHTWYNIRDGTRLGRNETVEVGENATVAIRGGAIIVCQEPPSHGPVTTTNSRSQPQQLLVVPDSSSNAAGELYWDAGDNIRSYEEDVYSIVTFNLNGTTLTGTPKWWGYGVPPINNITIFEQPPVSRVVLNNHPCEPGKQSICEFTYYPKTRVLELYNVKLLLNSMFQLDLTYSKDGQVDTKLPR